MAAVFTSISNIMKTACSKSWTDVNIDFANRLIRNCCRSKAYPMPDDYDIDFFNNSPQIQQRRSSTLSGEQHPDCTHCWESENAGIPSYRSQQNKWQDFSTVTRDPHTTYIDVTLDTICDQSCLYCAADTSSQIAQEEGVPIRDDGTERDFETFKRWVSTLSGSIVFNFLGGEPTASKRFAPMVEYINTLPVDAKFEICTNCNTKAPMMERLLKTIRGSGKPWNIAISNETFGTDAELSRYGLDWERFKTNFITYATTPEVSSITLAPTTNALSIRGLADYIEWVHETMLTVAPDKSFSWHGSYITRPSVIDIKNLDTDHRKHIVRAQEVYARYHNQHTKLQHAERFKQYLQSMHDRIGTGFSHTTVTDFILDKQQIKNQDLSKLL